MSIQQLTLGAADRAALVDLTRTEANGLLTEWGHYLGGCDRPFGQQAVALLVAGDPVSVAVSASTVSPTVLGIPRREVVELARLCSAPGEAWATRVMLRLWRELVAPSWPHWPVTTAIAYSASNRHEGRVYRFDGWERAAGRAGSTGGGTWSKPRPVGHAARGPKSLWVWRFPTAAHAPP